MSNLLLNLNNVNNVPDLKVTVNKNNAIKDTIFKAQNKNNLSDVFLDDAKNIKSDISFLHGLVIERQLATKDEFFTNYFVVVLENNDKEMLFNFKDNENSIKNNIPTIKNLSRNKKCSILYNVKYFSFQTNLVNLSNIKIEEELIYEYYKKYKANLSSGKLKKIVSQIKQNKRFQNLDPIFYSIYEVNRGSTETIQLNNIGKQDISIKSNLIYNKNNLLLEVNLLNDSILKYDIDIKSIKFISSKKSIEYVIKEADFSKKQIKNNLNKKKAYFNLLKKETYDFYLNSYKFLKLKIEIRFYAKNNDSIIKNKTETFILQD